MPDTVVPTVGRLREVLDEWFAGPTLEEAATLDQVTSSARDDKGLGIVITEHDPLDRDTVTDQEFAEWICRGWLAEGKAWENGQVTVWLASRPTWDPDEEAWRSVEHVELETLRWVDFYNTTRPHEALEDLTPMQAEDLHYHRLKLTA